MKLQYWSIFKKYETTILYTILFAGVIYLLVFPFIRRHIEGLEGMSGDNGGGQGQGQLMGTTMDDGIPMSQIPDGDEDLYVLKSSIVPPVCPKCPDISISGCPQKETCPPCPACARCPEPSFECKKVPTFNPNNSFLPEPMLNDFSQFGF